jgi:hypothetical protein
MLDFRRDKSKQDDARNSRRRLLGIVFLLGLVVILTGRSRDPSVWRWIDRVVTPEQATSGDLPIDNRLEGAGRSTTLPADTFLMPLERKPVTLARPAGSSGYFPGVDIADFEGIRDDAPSSRDEQAVTLRLLQILDQTDAKELAEASQGSVTYAQLFRQSDQYRGRLVTVSGMVRRVNRLQLSERGGGLRRYYQVWLWPTDNPTAPLVIYCLNLPAGFPTGMKVAEQAEVTGFFLKRWAYSARDSLRTAPELLAKTLHWDKRPMMVAEEPAETWMIAWVAGIAVAGALLAAWLVQARTRPKSPNLPEETPDFDLLRQFE